MTNNCGLILVVHRRLRGAGESCHLQMQQPLRAVVDSRSDIRKSTGQKGNKSRMIDAFGHTRNHAGELVTRLRLPITPCILSHLRTIPHPSTVNWTDCAGVARLGADAEFRADILAGFRQVLGETVPKCGDSQAGTLLPRSPPNAASRGIHCHDQNNSKLQDRGNSRTSDDVSAKIAISSANKDQDVRKGI